MSSYDDDIFDASGMDEDALINSNPVSKKEDKKEDSKIIKVKAKHNRNLFPRFPLVLDGKENTYGITLWEILEVLEGEPVEDRSGCITVTGEFLDGIDETKPYIVLAKEIIHPKWGVQYELLYYTPQTDLTKMNNQVAFLRVFLSPGQIEECYKVFENPLEVIANHDVESLKKVHGIGDYIANCIINRYEDNKDMSAVYMELDSMGLTTKFISKLVQSYRSPQKIISTVKENPYQLTYDIDGIGFLTADAIALKNGMNPKSPKRIGAFINYYLRDESEKGHSYVTAGELIVNIYSQFGGKENIVENYLDEEGNVVGNNISKAINSLVEEGIIKIEDNTNKARRRIYLTKIYDLEKEIALNLKRLLNAPNRFNYLDWEEKVSKLEEKQGFQFAEEQRNGIKLGLDKQVCLISGLAGSGKSSLVSGILASLDGYSFAQCALSGKAAARLQEVTGQEGSTIHRLLGFENLNFRHNEENTLPYDIIILDEISLVGGDIFLSLIKAIRTGCKLIMLGDLGQLEAIGPLSLAADMYNSPVIPTVELKQIHRQAQKSGIITSAHDVRNQIQLYETLDYKGVDVRGELQDMIFEMNPEKDEIFTKSMEYFEKYYNSDLVNKNIMNIQLISPVKERGESCVFKLNLGVQQLINPVEDYKDKIHIKMAKDKDFYIQVGDKVMCIKNNYSTVDVDGMVSPIYNGWTGMVVSIDENNVEVNFPLSSGKNVLVPLREAKSSLILGYASTVHKCVTGDTFVYTSEGIKQIKDLKGNWKNIKIFNGEYYESPSNFFHNPILPCRKITTDFNYTLTGTLDHGIYVLEQGKLVRKEFRELVKGDCLLALKDINSIPEDKKDGSINNLEKLLKNYNIVQITKIEECNAETYCLEMPETHRFIQNGFLGSNCQGSDIPVVIGALDYSTPPKMLTCQLVYTLLTRAKKRCIIVAQTGALRKAISTDFVSTKRTFLKEFLNNPNLKK